MKMLLAPVVSREISWPPRTPRGSSCVPPGLMTFTALSLPLGGELVVQPLGAPPADAVVDRLGGDVVLGRLPGDARRTVRAGTLATLGDQRVGDAAPAGVLADVEVVHDRQARGGQRLPRPVDRREADRAPAQVAGE